MHNDDNDSLLFGVICHQGAMKSKPHDLARCVFILSLFAHEASRIMEIFTATFLSLSLFISILVCGIYADL